MELKTKMLYSIVCIYFIFQLNNCASIGEGPSGGDYDRNPPKFLHSTPVQNSIHINQPKIDIFFDKYILLQNPSEKIIISPPQNNTPFIDVNGKKITIKLKDSLLKNMTYTLDFTDGIIDSNEGNILKNFSFAFSTGDVVDSLCISGTLLNAETLDPMPNILIGIHSNLDDTAFITIPFLRAAKTDENGCFQIKNIAKGIYHIFALNDINKNFKFDSPLEALAFCDSLIVPSFYKKVISDTIWLDSITTDTTKTTIQETHFMPDNIILRLFKEDIQFQHLLKTKRISNNQWIMNFYSEIHDFPKIRLLNGKKDWYIEELSSDKKIITYWITDSSVYSKDTFLIEATYQITDSAHQIMSTTDTICLSCLSQPRKMKDQSNKKIMEIKISPEKILEIFDTIKIIFSEPVAPSFKENCIQLHEKKDTSWEACSFSLSQDSLNPRTYLIHYPWKFCKEYQISIDSGAIFSIYNNENRSIQVRFKTKSENDYGDLCVKIIGAQKPGFGQILDKNENIVRKAFLINDQLVFRKIKLGKYFLRYIEDRNANGKWDTGNYFEKKQPEEVFYFPNPLEIKESINLEQIWNLNEIPANKQKPLEIIKNKSKGKTTDIKADIK